MESRQQGKSEINYRMVEYAIRTGSSITILCQHQDETLERYRLRFPGIVFEKVSSVGIRPVTR